MQQRLRECYTCLELKEGSEFYAYGTQCKHCLKARRKKRIARDPETYKKQNIRNCAKYRARLIKRNSQ